MWQTRKAILKQSAARRPWAEWQGHCTKKSNTVSCCPTSYLPWRAVLLVLQLVLENFIKVGRHSPPYLTLVGSNVALDVQRWIKFYCKLRDSFPQHLGLKHHRRRCMFLVWSKSWKAKLLLVILSAKIDWISFWSRSEQVGNWHKRMLSHPLGILLQAKTHSRCHSLFQCGTGIERLWDFKIYTICLKYCAMGSRIRSTN